MFVDDNLFASYQKDMKQTMAASIEAFFLILGSPKPERRQCALLLDKFINSLCSFERAQLGFLINTRTMMVALTNDKLSKLKALLTNWHKSCRSFTLQQIANLVGIL